MPDASNSLASTRQRNRRTAQLSETSGSLCLTAGRSPRGCPAHPRIEERKTAQGTCGDDTTGAQDQIRRRGTAERVGRQASIRSTKQADDKRESSSKHEGQRTRTARGMLGGTQEVPAASCRNGADRVGSRRHHTQEQSEELHVGGQSGPGLLEVQMSDPPRLGKWRQALTALVATGGERILFFNHIWRCYNNS